jgi:hypothetical protein
MDENNNGGAAAAAVDDDGGLVSQMVKSLPFLKEVEGALRENEDKLNGLAFRHMLNRMRASQASMLMASGSPEGVQDFFESIQELSVLLHEKAALTAEYATIVLDAWKNAGRPAPMPSPDLAAHTGEPDCPACAAEAAAEEANANATATTTTPQDVAADLAAVKQALEALSS